MVNVYFMVVNLAYVHSSVPIKYEYNVVWIGGAEIMLNKFNIDFPMIKWADEYPWKILKIT